MSAFLRELASGAVLLLIAVALLCLFVWLINGLFSTCHDLVQHWRTKSTVPQKGQIWGSLTGDMYEITHSESGAINWYSFGLGYRIYGRGSLGDWKALVDKNMLRLVKESP